MQFWEADSFDLDDNINDYLDDFQVHIPYHNNDTVTFRMLMTHTSNIADNWNVFNALTVCGDSPILLDTFLINYFTPGGIYYNSSLNFLNATPGTMWQYCNAGICILAYLVEKFSGMSFEQYCQDNIFNPLEMNQTSWFLEGMDTTAVATPYIWQGGQYVPYCHQGFPYYPAGQLRTNKIELEHFLSAYKNWGRYNGITILDSSTVELILTDQLGYSPPWPLFERQGLIWFQWGELNGRFPWGHSGDWWGCRAGIFFQQEEEWGIIWFMNSTPDNPVLLYLSNLLCDYAQDVTEVEKENTVIENFYLEQNYPNPFNPVTSMQ
jgi:CubicO group peptidase (beta-lactamase class C family)